MSILPGSTATITGTYFDGNTAAYDAFTATDYGDDVFNDGTLTCPSACPSGTTGTCDAMSSDECYGAYTDCTCYSCSCS